MTREQSMMPHNGNNIGLRNNLRDYGEMRNVTQFVMFNWAVFFIGNLAQSFSYFLLFDRLSADDYGTRSDPNREAKQSSTYFTHTIGLLMFLSHSLNLPLYYKFNRNFRHAFNRTICFRLPTK